MRQKNLIWVLGLALACLLNVSCKTSDETDGDGTKSPNFVADACSGCPAEQLLSEGGVVTAIRFFSYVKNTGGSGKINMSIANSLGSASKEFAVAAGISYTFQSTVPVAASGSSSFTYLAAF